MPFQSLVIIGAIVALFVAFAATLAWARWYAGATPRSERPPAE